MNSRYLYNYLSRRGVHSKFSLPIRSNEEDNSSNQNNNSNYQNKINPNNNNNESNNIDMANMKNIDQKLIDIIMSEVLNLIIFHQRYSI